MRRIVYSAAVGDDAERFGAVCRDRPRRSYRDAAAVDAGAAAVAGKSKDADAAPALGRNPRAGVIHEDWRGIRHRSAQRPNTDWVSENTGIGSRRLPNMLMVDAAFTVIALPSAAVPRIFRHRFPPSQTGRSAFPRVRAADDDRGAGQGGNLGRPDSLAPAKMPLEVFPCTLIVPLR